jgi:signal transduction histidine kinase
MGEALRVLFIEDSSDDAELEAMQLRRAGFDVTATRVYTAADLEAVIDGPWQVIIADYNMPSFTGLDALSIWRERRSEVPFLLVSGTLGEDRAVDALKAGAADYLIKDNLRRLGPAVVRALREATDRRARERDNQGAHFLAQASALLAENLDYRSSLQQVARLMVPAFADWCAVDIVDEAGQLQRLTLVEGDGVSGPPHLPVDGRLGAAQLAAAARSRLIGLVDEQNVPDPAERASFDQLGVRSYVAVPVLARGAVLGALTLASSRPERIYDATDLAFAEELARRVGFAVDNARLFDRTQEAVRLRDDFLSVASHELRTPLTTIQLQLQSLLAAASAGKPSVVQPSDEPKLRRAVRSTERLSDLVDTLVDVSRIASGNLPLSRVRVDLVAAARRVVERFNEASGRAEAPLRLQAPDGEPIVGHWDRERIEQVIGNLLANALKYGAGKPIDLELSSREGWAEIGVRDRGMGIAAVDLERIFGRFERAVSVRNYGGLGLGLYMTREIVRSHGGSIHATSTPGEGATFTVRLPLGSPPP